MPATLIFAGLIAAQAAPAITVETSRGLDEVGYRELVAQRPADAIARIDANRALDADNPAALINKGTAKARLGDRATAADLYRAALVSRQRYDLELADGTWVDSREAARRALRMLDTGEALALR